MYHSGTEIRQAIEAKEEAILARMLDDSDYDRGKIESLEQTVENLSRAFVRLLLFLVEKQGLTKSEATSVISGSYDDSDGDDEG